MRLIIAGQGAIGSLLAYRCELHGVDYRILPRKARQSIQFCPNEGAELTLPSAEQNPAMLKGDELIILPLKAYQIAPCIERLTPFLTDQTLLLLHNGMGVIDHVRRTAPDCSLIQGVTRLAAFRNHNRVTQTAQGDTHLSWVKAVNESRRVRVERTLNEVLEPACWLDDLTQPLWQKLIINAVINPLTAIHGIRNGELNKPGYQATIAGLISEARAVMQAAGVVGSEELEQRVAAVIQSTAENYSSMYQDINQQRPTEVDYINGFLCQTGKQLGVPTPLHSDLVQRIHQLTQN